MKNFRDFIENSQNEDFDLNGSDYLYRIKQTINNDPMFKSYDLKGSKVEKFGLGMALVVRPSKLFSTTKPIIYFPEFSNSVEFNFDNVKIMSWNLYDEADDFGKKIHKLIHFYSYCEKIAKKNWY
jgi:hypothetical protein